MARRSLLLGGGLACLSAAWTGACTVELETRVEGSGVLVHETREVPDFVQLSVVGDLAVRYEPAPVCLVVVSGDDNLVGLVLTEVDPSNGRLELRVVDGYSLVPTPTVEVHAPALDTVMLQGSGRADLTGLAGGSFELSTTGSGDVRATGRVDDLRLRVVGSGDVDLSQLEVERAQVETIGSGDVVVTRSRSVIVRAVGSGDVFVDAAAQIDRRAVGSGRIVEQHPGE